MKTIALPHDMPLPGDERLMDAMLHEHARAGSQADPVCLKRLSASLDAEATDGTQPAAPELKRAARTRRLAWPLGLAAGLALAGGLIWKYPPANTGNLGQVGELGSGKRTPLTTELPPELIEGTPVPINEPKLVPAPTRAPEFMVPQGTVLLSKGKKVTSSDDNPIIGSLDLITDGEKDAGEGYFVELLDGLQWVTIDLEQSAPLHAIWIWHFHSQRRAYHDVVVQISDDPLFKSGVTTVFNNDYDQSAQLGKATDNPYVETRFGRIVDAKATRGRYVRLFSNGNTSNEMNHYIEVEVYGSPD